MTRNIVPQLYFNKKCWNEPTNLRGALHNTLLATRIWPVFQSGFLGFHSLCVSDFESTDPEESGRHRPRSEGLRTPCPEEETGQRVQRSPAFGECPRGCRRVPLMIIFRGLGVELCFEACKPSVSVNKEELH